jgi:hypothetical protein
MVLRLRRPELSLSGRALSRRRRIFGGRHDGRRIADAYIDLDRRDGLFRKRHREGRYQLRWRDHVFRRCGLQRWFACANAHTRADPDTKADPDAWADADGGAKSDASAEPDSRNNTDPDAKPNTHTYSVAYASADADTQADTNAGTEPDSSTKSDVSAEPDSRNNTDPDAKPNTHTYSVAYAGADAHPEADTDSKADADAHRRWVAGKVFDQIRV